MSCDQLRREITILRNDLSFANQRAEDAKAELEIMHGFYLAAIARAETAEADADLRATERDSAIDRALSAEMQLEAAKAQLAALQAAGEWRPVDDKPAHGQDVEVCAILTGVWWDDDGIFDVYQVPDEITIKGWRPAPPQE